MSIQKRSLPRIIHKIELPHTPELSRSRAYSKVNCCTKRGFSQEILSFEDKTGNRKQTIVQASPLKNNFKVLLVQRPQRLHQFSTNEWTSKIKSDPRIIQRIVLGLVKRIARFQSRRIFHPDVLLLHELDQEFKDNEQVLSVIDNHPNLTEVKDLLRSQYNFAEFIKGMKKKHSQTYQFYKQFDGNLIRKEFQIQIRLLEQLFRKGSNSLKNSEMEAEIQKFCARQNMRLLLYLMSSLTFIIRSSNLPLFAFVKYYYSQLIKDNQNWPDITTVKKQLEDIFNTQQFSLPERRSVDSRLVQSSKNVQFADLPVVGGRPTSSRVQIELSNSAHAQLENSPIDSIMLLQQTQYLEQPSKIRCVFIDQKTNVSASNLHQIELKNILNNIKLNIICLFDKALKENALINNISKYEIMNSRKNSKGQFSEFQYKMLVGQQQFSQHFRNSGGEINVSHLKRQGFEKVLSFIVSLSQCLIELQELGIYHADLKIKNFIQFNNIFQVIDFNFALMCKRNSTEWKNFEKLTRYVLNYWLTNPYSCIDIFFDRFERFESIKMALKFNTLNLIQAINICLESLPQLQIQGHKSQFLAIINQIVDWQDQISPAQIFTQVQLSIIKKLVKQFITDQERPLYSEFKKSLLRNFGLRDGKTVELASQYLEKGSMLRQVYQQRLQKIIEVHRILSGKRLTYISRPYFDESYIIDDNQTIDFKITYRDDSHDITKEYILFQGEIYIYEFIVRVIKIVQEMQYKLIYHPNLKLKDFVFKSKTIELRYLHQAQAFQAQSEKNIQQENVCKGLCNEHFFELLSLANFQRQQQNMQSKRQALQKAKRCHMNSVKKMIKDLINIQAGFKDKNGQSYDVFMRTERHEIEKHINNISCQNHINNMSCQGGYNDLYNYSKQQRSRLMRSLSWHQN